MNLPVIVINVAAFGAFADIGIYQGGLVHISQISDQLNHTARAFPAA